MRKIFGIIQSNVSHYQAILTNAFIQFLSQHGASKKTGKNYVSDLGHFFSWFSTQTMGNITDISDYALQMNAQSIDAYRVAMLQMHVPSSTINRRLSSLRMFFTCCLTHQWIDYHPMDGIANIKTARQNAHHDDIIDQFHHHLIQEGLSKATRKNYVSDVRQFVVWFQSITTRQSTAYEH